jgi:hypothetical protein
MAEQMILEDWESEEAQDWESADEAIAGFDESAEDYGEAARRPRKSRFAPVRGGVSGITLSGPGGAKRNFSFPSPVATTAQTNRVVANQRRLDDQLDQIGRALRVQRKSDVSTAGAVTLLLGGGLTIWGLMKASQGGFSFTSWAKEGSTEIAAGFSAMQLATSGVKLAMTGGHYTRSVLGTAGDLFAAAQLAAFAFGSLPSSSLSKGISGFVYSKDLDVAYPPVLTPYEAGSYLVNVDKHKTLEVLVDSNNNNQKTYTYVD